MARSEEHTSELQSPQNLVCRLLLEKKKRTTSRSGTCRCAMPWTAWASLAATAARDLVHLVSTPAAPYTRPSALSLPGALPTGVPTAAQGIPQNIGKGRLL